MTLFETKYSPITQCLKIFKKISFKIASETSYVYLLSGQKLLKNAKNGQFSKTRGLSKTVLPDMSKLIGQIWLKLSKLKNSNATFWVNFKHNEIYFILRIYLFWVIFNFLWLMKKFQQDHRFHFFFCSWFVSLWVSFVIWREK